MLLDVLVQELAFIDPGGATQDSSLCIYFILRENVVNLFKSLSAGLEP